VKTRDQYVDQTKREKREEGKREKREEPRKYTEALLGRGITLPGALPELNHTLIPF
jgi:hypothetical protein